MNRKQARENAFLFVFERQSRPEEDAREIYERAAEVREAETDAYTEKVYFGIEENAKQISDILEAHLIGWKKSRVSAVSTAILTLSAYEILFMDDIPDRVSINEAVELAKKFDDEKAYSFVNGVLNAIAKEKEAKAEAPAEEK